MDEPTVRVAVVMERRALGDRWGSVQWEPIGILPDESDTGSAPHALLEHADRAQWLHPGLELALHRDEAEGYYLNMSSPQPCVFVMWRLEEDRALPVVATLSYNEAARMMDGGEHVDNVPMPAEMRAWLAEYVERHYKPEPKKRIRPPSFKGARRDS